MLDAPLLKYLLLWLDDVLLHARTVHKLLDSVASFFNVCLQYNVKLQPEKCVLFDTSTTWCGRKISKDGIKLDCRRIHGLLYMETPTTVLNCSNFFVRYNGCGLASLSFLNMSLHCRTLWN